MNRRNNRRPALQKEKISIIAASVFVLSALTLAGVYMSAQGDVENEENRIDLQSLNKKTLQQRKRVQVWQILDLSHKNLRRRYQEQKKHWGIPGLWTKIPMI